MRDFRINVIWRPNNAGMSDILSLVGGMAEYQSGAPATTWAMVFYDAFIAPWERKPEVDLRMSSADKNRLARKHLFEAYKTYPHRGWKKLRDEARKLAVGDPELPTRELRWEILSEARAREFRALMPKLPKRKRGAQSR